MNLKELEKYFWDNYPHEISWSELREINSEAYCKLQNIGQILVLNNLLNSKYLGG